MPVKDLTDWDFSDRGERDAQRHREKIDDAIRKGVKDVISEESIITKRKGRKVRIPVKGMKDYRFVYSSGKGKVRGAGQGEGKPGDVISRKPKQGQGGSKPGNKPGEDYMEAEVDIDYLIEIMFQDLGLPWIEEKTKVEKLIPQGWKFETISKRGIIPRLHKKRTLMETIKRTASYAGEVIRETGCSEDDAYLALAMAKDDINESISIIKENRLDRDFETHLTIDDEDMRFKKIEPNMVPHSNAVVIAMMDTSGSMTTDKKYLARSMLFWMVEFLKKTYDNVEIKFIQHTTVANVVDEDTFFHKGECHTKGHYIEMSDGNVKDISDMEIGDIVISLNASYEREPKKVTRVYKKEVENLKFVEIKSGQYMECTPNHKYFIFNKTNGLIYEKELQNIDKKNEMLITKDNVIRFNDLIGSRSPYLILDDKVKNLLNNSNSKLNEYNYFKYIPHRWNNSYHIPRKYVKNLINDSMINNDHPLYKLMHRGLYALEIKNIGNINGTQEVFDIRVEDNSSYIIDGIYSHNSGGTMCWTAIDKALHLIETEFPVDSYNVYCIYISDGEDWEPPKTIPYIERLLEKNINMFSYVEIDTEAENDIYGWKSENTLIKEIQKRWKFKTNTAEGTNFYKNEEEHFLLSIIRNKNHIYPCLKHMLFSKN